MSNLIKKVIYFFSYEKCFKEKEYEGHAAFGLCSGMAGGDKETDYLSYCCISCPHLELLGREFYGKRR